MPQEPRPESPTNRHSPSLGPSDRLAVTVLASVAVALLSRPSITDVSALPGPPRSVGYPGVFFLGVMPFITASCLVEIVAAIVPRWAPLRHGGPRSRAKLERASLILSLSLCVFQAFAFARMLSSVSRDYALGPVSVPLVVLTLTAGAFVLCFLARLIGAYGLTGGFGLLLVASPIIDQGVTIAQQWRIESGGRLLEPLDLGAFGLLSAAVVAVTWYALRPRPAGPPAAAPERSYRAPPEEEQAPPLEIPVPASGVAPLLITASLLALPATLVNLDLPLQGVVTALQNDTVFRGVALVLIAVLCAGLSWDFNQPARVAALREGGRSFADLEAAARAALGPAMARTLLFSVVLFGLSQVANELIGPGFQAIELALATALALDIAAELRARRALPDLVPVWPEHRPYALAAARAVLLAAGIPVHARNERLRRMLQFFGPYVPIELMVRRADAEQAAKVLAQALSPEAESARDLAKDEATLAQALKNE